MGTAVLAQPLMVESEFLLFQKLIYDTAGINMTSAKKALVSGRLSKRLKHFGLKSYADYFHLLMSDKNGEMQTAIDLLTTNETYFFREIKHFDFLRDKVLPKWGAESRRLWSAASSTGEEAYSLAMLLMSLRNINAWEIVGTDICTHVLTKARAAQYPIERAENIPKAYLHKYCLKGIGSKAGSFIIDKELCSRVQFVHANLKENLLKLGNFDVIFLRNVLIYFDLQTKQLVVSQLLRQLKPGGFFIVGHSESLNGISGNLKVVAPSVYQKSC